MRLLLHYSSEYDAGAGECGRPDNNDHHHNNKYNNNGRNRYNQHNDNDGYQHCVNISEKVLHEQYGLAKDQPVRFDYQLDVRRFPDQAEQGVIRFQAAGVTT